MIIELLGCTSSGKSTLLRKITGKHRGDRAQVISAEESVLTRLRLTWLPHGVSRRVAMNVIGIIRCLLAYGKYRSLLGFSFAYLKQLPPSVHPRERIKIARILCRNIGIYDLIQASDRADSIVVLDEGTLHIAHYLFVYESVEPDLERLGEFVSLVPIPDAVVRLSVSKKQLIERTMHRGHERVRGGSYESVESFISHAIRVFESLETCAEVRERLVLVDPGGDVEVSSCEGGTPLVHSVMELLRSC